MPQLTHLCRTLIFYRMFYAKRSEIFRHQHIYAIEHIRNKVNYSWALKLSGPLFLELISDWMICKYEAMVPLYCTYPPTPHPPQFYHVWVAWQQVLLWHPEGNRHRQTKQSKSGNAAALFPFNLLPENQYRLAVQYPEWSAVIVPARRGMMGQVIDAEWRARRLYDRTRGRSVAIPPEQHHPTEYIIIHHCVFCLICLCLCCDGGWLPGAWHRLVQAVPQKIKSPWRFTLVITVGSLLTTIGLPHTRYTWCNTQKYRRGKKSETDKKSTVLLYIVLCACASRWDTEWKWISGEVVINCEPHYGTRGTPGGYSRWRTENWRLISLRHEEPYQTAVWPDIISMIIDMQASYSILPFDYAQRSNWRSFLCMGFNYGSLVV